MEKQLNLCGVTFNFSVEGEGKPVVLMHGWGCNRTTLARIEQLLVPHFKVYNVDFPGFGKSQDRTFGCQNGRRNAIGIESIVAFLVDSPCGNPLIQCRHWFLSGNARCGKNQ